MTDRLIEDRLADQAARVRHTYQDHIAADVMALAAGCLRAAAETISRLEAGVENQRLTTENQELRELLADLGHPWEVFDG